MTILDEIIQHKVTEVRERKQKRPLILIREKVTPCDRDFKAALTQPGISVIAEIKRQSPSAGLIREDFDPSHIADIYTRSGASAISVLTDAKYFGGHSSYLMKTRSHSTIPILRKDFIIDPYQIVEARALGANAVLLIASVLEAEEIDAFIETASEMGMDCLVEVHDEAELEKALGTKASIIGINNRDLKTFTIDLDTSLRLRSMVPESIVTVSESGIETREDVIRLEEAGFDAILVGTTLMKSGDIGARLRELTGRRAA